MRVALVHDWLTGMRGGEKCLEIFCELFPDAPVYTLLHVKGSVSPVIESHTIHSSYIQKFPWVKSQYRSYLPFFPRAIESFDFSKFDLVLSSSHCVAKGARVPNDALHICYCHTPMRYVWDQYDEYFGRGRANITCVDGIQKPHSASSILSRIPKTSRKESTAFITACRK